MRVRGSGLTTNLKPDSSTYMTCRMINVSTVNLTESEGGIAKGITSKHRELDMAE
jgi:hypothetical protein